MEDRLLDKLQAHISSISQRGGETGGSGTTPEATVGTGEAQGEQMRWCIGRSRQQTTAAAGQGYICGLLSARWERGQPMVMRGKITCRRSSSHS